MKERLKFLISYILFWLLLFIAGRLVFLFYHHQQSFELATGDWFGIILYGLKLDLSVIGYIMIFPLNILIFSAILPGKIWQHIINIYTVIIIAVFILFTVTDVELYKYWGFRLDKTPLQYLNTPQEMMASVRWYTIVLGILLWLVFAFTISFIYQKFISVFIKKSHTVNFKAAILYVVLLPLLIIPIRGGFDSSPVNLSAVYFHENHFANHAAVNILWNFGYSLTIKSSKITQFDYLDPEEARNITYSLYSNSDNTNYLINNEKPNIILLVLESFTAKLVEPLGGVSGITPEFNKLTGQGVFFTNFYANDSRSDKGMVAIISGYPALGIVSVIKSPKKTQSLQYISKCLKDSGYQTSFYYGGDINFANLNSYLFNGDFDEIISKSHFKKAELLSNWGAPDHILFNRLLNDIHTSKRPFFRVCFSLSNHEPFDVPMKPVFQGGGQDTKMFNSSFYTDSCLGDFIGKMRASQYWNNTLIIILADHGHIFPGWTPVYGFKKYHIPMLWLGGVINKDTVVAKYGSQTDLAKTLLNQMQISGSEFIFSKDLLSGSSESFAFYDYNNGFGFLNDSIRYIFDNDSRRIIVQEGPLTDVCLNQGKALQQVYYMDFYNR
jgi:phosphoglycerol transferase MdoB-like AlkP superfamily enzyme